MLVVVIFGGYYIWWLLYLVVVIFGGYYIYIWWLLYLVVIIFGGICRQKFPFYKDDGINLTVHNCFIQLYIEIYIRDLILVVLKPLTNCNSMLISLAVW